MEMCDVDERTVIVIRPAVPPSRRVPVGLAELAAYHELLWFMTSTRLRLRYRQSCLGWIWAVVQPLTFMAVLSVAGYSLGGRNIGGVVYPLFIIASLPPWAFFATSVSTSTAGMLASSSLLSKVYFPREIVPLSHVLAAFADLAIATAIAVAALILVGRPLPISVVVILPICLILSLFVAAASLLLSIVQINFRDITIGLPLLLQVLMFTSPVLYPLEAVPASWRALYELNPLALLVEAFRNALLGSHPVSFAALFYATALGILVLGISYFVFKTLEPRTVDEI